MPFERFELLVGSKNFQKIQQLKVMVVGVGGVGGYVVESLARCGIATLVLVDFDTVSLSNLNRQIIATYETVGEKKVEVFQKRIQQISPATEVIALATSFDVSLLSLYPVDFVVDACDDLTAKKALLTECLRLSIPFLSCMGTGKRLDPSKLVITTLDKTHSDPLARVLRKYVKDNRIRGKIPVLASEEVPQPLPGKEIASCSFVPASAGLLITSYIIRSQLKEKERIQN